MHRNTEVQAEPALWAPGAEPVHAPEAGGGSTRDVRPDRCLCWGGRLRSFCL